MDLTTNYLGLSLKNPLMPGASPLADNLDNVRRLEDAGAAAIVVHSLFAEQIDQSATAVARHLDRWTNSFAEAERFFPAAEDYAMGPERYLEHLRKIKAAVQLPLIASLNGTTLGSWIDYAQLIEQAGADALELNTYFLATDPRTSGAEIEARLLEVLRAVRRRVRIPIAVKLSPFFSSVGHVVNWIEEEGADGVVLFNRFFQPEIDIDELEVVPRLDLSNAEDLRLRLRWIGLLRDRVGLSLACSGGVHGAADVVKALLAGADVVQVVATLLRRGPGRIGELLQGLQQWMEDHTYESVTQLRGALCARRSVDAEAYERANYLRTLQLWRE